MSDPILDYFNSVRTPAPSDDEDDPIVAAFNAARGAPKSVAESARERLTARGVNPDVPVDRDANMAAAMAQPDASPQAAASGTWGGSRAAQARGTMDLLVGAGKGVIDTASTLGRLPWWTGAGAIGRIPPVKRFVNDPDLPAALEGSNTQQKVGKFTERVGEFALGSGLTNAATKAVPILSRAATAAPRVANVVKNAVSGGAVTGAQGGDPIAGAVIGGGLAAAGELVGPLARALTESAVKSYSRAMGATKEAMKNVSLRSVKGYEVAGEKVPGLIERGVTAWSRKGLADKAAQEVAALGDQIDTLWAAVPQGQKIPVSHIETAIAQAKSALTEIGPAKSMTVKLADVLPSDAVQSVNAALGTATVQRSATVAIEPAAVRNLDRMGNMIANLTDDSGMADVQQLRRVKQVIDEVVASRGGYAGKQLSLADQAGVLARRETANAIREQLAAANPDIAAINRQFHFWKGVENVLGETLKRTTPQAKPLGQQLARVAGSAAAGHSGVGAAVLTGEAAGLLKKLTTSAAWNTTSAVIKDRLAQLLASGKTGAATLLMRAIQAGVAGGGTSGVGVRAE